MAISVGSARASKLKARKVPAGTSMTSKGIEARQRIVSVAETLFTRHGFDGTSMRDIAAEADMQAASIYYYFPSKDELLWAVWEQGGVELLERVSNAIAGHSDPWAKLEAACIAHVGGLLDWRRANQVLFVMPPWQYPPRVRDRVVALRDKYEGIFADLINAVPLRKGIDRRYFRLTIIGALSWSLYWYKSDGDPPAAVARNILDILRVGAMGTTPLKRKR